jgi:hypothetical protein
MSKEPAIFREVGTDAKELYRRTADGLILHKAATNAKFRRSFIKKIIELEDSGKEQTDVFFFLEGVAFGYADALQDVAEGKTNLKIIAYKCKYKDYIDKEPDNGKEES